MKKVADVLMQKEKGLICVQPKTTVLEALSLMAEKDIGSVLVMEGSKYAGLLTERDYARKVILKSKSSHDTMVKEIMSTDLPHITPADTIEVCMQLMTKSNIRYLPVFENNQVCGLVSVNDIIRIIISSHEETIAHLQSYINS